MKLIIPQQYKSFEYLHNIKWRDIFAVWRAYEAYQKSWQEHWGGRGFESWDQWRQDYIAPLRPVERNWSIWRVSQSWVDFKNIYGVPSRGWKRMFYENKMTIPLKEVAEKIIKTTEEKNEKVEAVKNNFPYQTMLTGIINDDKIILVEGMHRGVALAMMNKKEITSDVVMALTKIDEKLDMVLGKG